MCGKLVCAILIFEYLPFDMELILKKKNCLPSVPLETISYLSLLAEHLPLADLFKQALGRELSFCRATTQNIFDL